MSFDRLRNLLQTFSNKNKNKNKKKPIYVGDEQCNTQMKNGIYDKTRCFSTNQIKATNITLDSKNMKVMKKVLGYNKEPVLNQHQCSLIAKYGNHCEGKNIYNKDEKACPLYLYREEDMYDGKTIAIYIQTKLTNIMTSVNVQKGEKEMGKLICEVGKANYEKYKKDFEESMMTLMKTDPKNKNITQKYANDTLERIISTCKSSNVKRSEKKGECWVVNDEIYNNLMQNVLDPVENNKNSKNDELYLTNLLDAEKNYKSFENTGEKLGDIFNTILDNEKYKNENMKYFQPTILQGVIQSSLSGEDIETVIQKYQTELRLKTDEEKKKIKKLILEYQTAIQKLSKNEKTIKKVIEKFGTPDTPDTIARKVSLNYEKLTMKNTFISILYYILMACILFIVFVMASAVSKGVSSRSVINNINSNIKNLLNT
jgi:uncharacterized protein YbgA (DUF1722 family)